MKIINFNHKGHKVLTKKNTKNIATNYSLDFRHLTLDFRLPKE